MGDVATIDRRAAAWGLAAVIATVALAIIGSGNLRWFDAALVGYLFGIARHRMSRIARVTARDIGTPLAAPGEESLDSDAALSDAFLASTIQDSADEIDRKREIDRVRAAVFELHPGGFCSRRMLIASLYSGARSTITFSEQPPFCTIGTFGASIRTLNGAAFVTTTGIRSWCSVHIRSAFRPRTSIGSCSRAVFASVSGSKRPMS